MRAPRFGAADVGIPERLDHRKLEQRTGTQALRHPAYLRVEIEPTAPDLVHPIADQRRPSDQENDGRDHCGGDRARPATALGEALHRRGREQGHAEAEHDHEAEGEPEEPASGHRQHREGERQDDVTHAPPGAEEQHQGDEHEQEAPARQAPRCAAATGDGEQPEAREAEEHPGSREIRLRDGEIRGR